MKQTTPSQQKRMVEDVERRMSTMFDSLNCETLSPNVIEGLSNICKAMSQRDREGALGIHLDLLTLGSKTEDIGLWMSALKQLIIRL